MKKALMIALCILTAAMALPAQEWKGQGRIPGIVVDEQGQPVEGVRVKLFCPKFEGGFETKTGKDGKWLGAWMRSGLWNIDFDKIGYSPVHKSLQMNQFEKYKEMTVVMRKIEGLVVNDDMKKDLTAANDLYDKKDYAAAIEAYKAFLAKFPDAYFVWRNIGNSYFVQEKYDEAETAYKEVLARDPNDAEAAISIGNCRSNSGDTDGALEWYGKVSLDKINDANLLYSVGLTYFKTQKLAEAAACFEKAVGLDGSQTDALYQLGITYTALQEKAKAIATFEKYLQADPDSERSAQVRSYLDYLKK
ncbi:MAG TPA: tetratricopeptide repeat protein [Candidatus Aminicenantes bacterium]|nr:tetratricopeptide repeat protein [Candidatus Aminicenantes bacterium]HRY64561.1 tetratricopeptide repeat protein [Candidatus Aminicenantes bacterium]HRZ71474.1 tetratricopeptide repeat protein [Candidatus Aminicenantes bacterium]